MSRFYIKFFVIVVLILFYSNTTQASDGTIDNSFIASGAFNTIDVNSVAVQADNKILVGGYFTSYDGIPYEGLIRLNVDGSLDTSFANCGYSADKINIQPDGKIVIVSYKTIVRLNQDGTLDTSFNLGDVNAPRNQGYIRNITIQADGKILIGGYFTSYNGTDAFDLVRINSDGSLDTSFINGLGGEVNSIAIQSDGKIIAVGKFVAYCDGDMSCIDTPHIARLNLDGSLDQSFVVGSGFDDDVSSVVIQSNGKIIAGGIFTMYDSQMYNHIIRLNQDGTVDSSFQKDVFTSSDIPLLIIQPDNDKIIVRKEILDGIYTYNMAQLTSNGAIDPVFSSSAYFNNNVNSFTTDSMGRLIVVGSFTSYNSQLAPQVIRLNADPVIFPPSPTIEVKKTHTKVVGYMPNFQLYQTVPSTKTTSLFIPISSQSQQVCLPLITENIQLGKKNSAKEVNKLVKFLNNYEGTNLSLDGIYGPIDFKAVKDFQKKYHKDIFSKNVNGKINGIVGPYTRNKINKLSCSEN